MTTRAIRRVRVRMSFPLAAWFAYDLLGPERIARCCEMALPAAITEHTGEGS